MIAQAAVELRHEQAAAERDAAARQADAWLMELADVLLSGVDAERVRELQDHLGLSDDDLLAMDSAIPTARRLTGLCAIAERAVDDLRDERFRRAARKFAAERAERMDAARIADAENHARFCRDAAGELAALAEKYPHLFDRSTDIPRLRTDDAEQVADAAHAEACRKRAQARLERVEREVSTAETYIGRNRGDADLWRHWQRTLRADQRRLGKELDATSSTDADDAVEEPKATKSTP